MSQSHQLLSGVWVVLDLTQDKEMLGNNRDRFLKCVSFITSPELTGMLFQVKRPRGPEAAPRSPPNPTPRRESDCQGPAQCPREKRLCSEEGVSQGSGPNDLDCSCPPPTPSHMSDQTHCPPLLRPREGPGRLGQKEC